MASEINNLDTLKDLFSFEKTKDENKLTDDEISYKSWGQDEISDVVKALKKKADAEDLTEDLNNSLDNIKELKSKGEIKAIGDGNEGSFFKTKDVEIEDEGRKELTELFEILKSDLRSNTNAKRSLVFQNTQQLEFATLVSNLQSENTPENLSMVKSAAKDLLKQVFTRAQKPSTPLSRTMRDNLLQALTSGDSEDPGKAEVQSIQAIVAIAEEVGVNKLAKKGKGFYSTVKANYGSAIGKVAADLLYERISTVFGVNPSAEMKEAMLESGVKDTYTSLKEKLAKDFGKSVEEEALKKSDNLFGLSLIKGEKDGQTEEQRIEAARTEGVKKVKAVSDALKQLYIADGEDTKEIANQTQAVLKGLGEIQKEEREAISLLEDTEKTIDQLKELKNGQAANASEPITKNVIEDDYGALLKWMSDLAQSKSEATEIKAADVKQKITEAIADYETEKRSKNEATQDGFQLKIYDGITISYQQAKLIESDTNNGFSLSDQSGKIHTHVSDYLDAVANGLTEKAQSLNKADNQQADQLLESYQAIDDVDDNASLEDLQNRIKELQDSEKQSNLTDDDKKLISQSLSKLDGWDYRHDGSKESTEFFENLRDRLINKKSNLKIKAKRLEKQNKSIFAVIWGNMLQKAPALAAGVGEKFSSQFLSADGASVEPGQKQYIQTIAKLEADAEIQRLKNLENMGPARANYISSVNDLKNSKKLSSDTLKNSLNSNKTLESEAAAKVTSLSSSLEAQYEQMDDTDLKFLKSSTDTDPAVNHSKELEKKLILIQWLVKIKESEKLSDEQNTKAQEIADAVGLNWDDISITKADNKDLKDSITTINSDLKSLESNYKHRKKLSDSASSEVRKINSSDSELLKLDSIREHAKLLVAKGFDLMIGRSLSQDTQKEISEKIKDVETSDDPYAELVVSSYNNGIQRKSTAKSTEKKSDEE